MSEGQLQDLYSSCTSSLLTCASLVTKYLDDDEKSTCIEQLKELVKKYSEKEHEIYAYNKALEDYNVVIDKSDDYFSDVDLEDFKKFLKKSTVNREPTVYGKFEEIISVVHQNPANFDESIVETGSTPSFVDPLTKLPLKNPVKNSICKHVYEESTIKEYIETSRRPKCPAMGCSNRNLIRKEHLIKNSNILTELSQASNENARNIHELD